MKILSILLFLIVGALDLVGQDFGSIYVPSASRTQLKLSNDNWHFVGEGESQFLAGPMSHWNGNTANTLTVEPGGEGDYLLKYSLGFQGSNGNWEIGIFKNNSELISVKQIYISGKRQQIVNLASEFFVTMNSGDNLRMAVRPTKKMARFTLTHARVTAIENESGESEFSSAQFSVGICKSYLADDWTSLSGFQCTKVNVGWCTSEEGITAGREGAGRYLVSYDTWFSARAGDAIIHKVRDLVSFGIATNGEIKNPNIPGLTIPVSDLRSEFANGFGIIEIAAGENISMKVMAHAPQTDVVLFRATISLYKLKDESNLKKSVLLNSDLETQPTGTALNQNFPNPFNPETQISYSLKQAGEVGVSVYDMRGAKIAQLVNEHQSLGSHTVNWDASEFPGGTYLCVLEVGETREVRKMTLIK